VVVVGNLALDLLGAFELRVGGRPVPVSSRRVRAFLTALALCAGRSVALDSLAEQVWDGRPPDRFKANLQTLARRARMLAGPDAVGTSMGGYLLDVPPDAVDALRFQRLVADARAAGPVGARAALAEALALWRGEPLVDAGSELLERQMGPVLRESRLEAWEQLVDLDLELGRPAAELVAELRELAGQCPLRESLWARLVSVLYRAGRPAEALEAYQAIRVRLAEELGTDPSAELQRTYATVLANDEPAAPAVAVRAAHLDAPPVPRQLPPRGAAFFGRDGDLTGLGRALLDTGGAGGDADGRLAAVHGPGGVGKTALVVHWAHHVADRFPDGQLFLDLRGYGPGEPVDPAQALDVMLRALGVPPAQVPPSTPERSALLRTRLADRRALLVLDNARDAAQVRPLLPGGPSLVVVTSRDELRGLRVRDGAFGWNLRELSAGDALALVRATIGDDRAAAEPAPVAELVELCGRLPLTLLIGAERIARFPQTPVATLVAELRLGERERLDALGDPADPAVDPRSVFSWSYRALEPPVARAFRLLGLHPGRQVTVPAAAALLDVPAGEARRLLAELVRVHLVEHDHHDWYRFHDLLRGYAADRAATEDAGSEGAAAVRRVLDWYRHTLHGAWQLVFAALPLRLDPPTGLPVPPLGFASFQQAVTWYDGLRATLLALVEHATDHGLWEHGWQLAVMLRSFQEIRHHVDDGLRVGELAVACAERTGDDAARIQAMAARGAALDTARQPDRALGWLRRALALCERTGDEAMASTCQAYIGLAHQRAGRIPEAVGWLERSAALAERSGSPGRAAHSLLNLGALEGIAGRAQASIGHSRRALDLYRKLGAGYFQGIALGNLAEAHLDNGDYHQARAYAEEAVALLGKLDDRIAASSALTVLGRALQLSGDATGARRAWQRALVILTEAGDPGASALRHLLSTQAPRLTSSARKG
jgi:DNA-binding SARP family transcriptional activator